LHAAAHAGHVAVVRLLVQANASLTAADARRRTPLDLAEAQLRNATNPPQSHAPQQLGSRTKPTQSAGRGQRNAASAGGSEAGGVANRADIARRLAVVEALRSAAGVGR
jgi:hypothetical protein